MDFELKTLTRARLCAEKTDALLVLVGQTPGSGADALSGLISQALKARDFEAKPGKLLAAYRPSGVAATRVVLAGVGDGSPKNIRSAVVAAMAGFKGGNVHHVTVCLADMPQPGPELARAVVLAGSDAAYSYTTTRSKPGPAVPERLTLVADSASTAKALQQGLDSGKALAKGIELAKEWANRPANHATPVLLAGAAKALGKLRGIKVDVLGPREVEKLGMGSFMAVAQGTAQPLRFIVLHYQGAPKTAAPVVLVGKGITFDTGGISIKPAADMDEMKFDMCGAASVLGTFRALAELRPALNVVGLIPACENMPGGRAVKPGDVVTSMSGQTIEILNTDAEGRLVLCDALTYAERFKPRAVVDIATLTGACVIALGGVRSGLFATDDALADALHQAGEASMDLCWRMPLDEDYADGLKTHFADVANVAGRAAGAVTAAKFLQRFATRFPWAHLDIAGTAWKSGAAKGATGRPVGLLVEYLLAEASRPSTRTAGKAAGKALGKSSGNGSGKVAAAPKTASARRRRAAAGEKA